MAATVIDELVLELGLDLGGVDEGRKKLLAMFNQLKNQMKRDGQEVEQTANQMISSLEKIAQKAATLFGAALGGREFGEFVGHMNRSLVAIGNLSKVINTSTQDISSWQITAEKLGGTAEGMAGTMQMLTSNFEEMSITGQSKLLPYLYALGIRVSDAAGKMIPVNDQLLAISDKLVGMHDNAKAAQWARDMGIPEDIIPVLLAGRKTLEEYNQAAKATSAINEDNVASAAAYTIQMVEFQGRMHKIGADFLTFINPQLDMFIGFMNAAANFAHDNPGLTNVGMSVLGIVAGLVGLRALLGGIAWLISPITALFKASSAGTMVVAGGMMEAASARMLTAAEIMAAQSGVAGLAKGAVTAEEGAGVLGAGEVVAGGLGGTIAGVGLLAGAVAGLGYLMYKNGKISPDQDALSKAKSLIRTEEGFSPNAKWDVNHYRAGYSSDTLTDPTTGKFRPVNQGDTVNRNQAEADLSRRLGQETDKLKSSVGLAAWQKLSSGAQAALYSVMYQYGRLPASVLSAARTGSSASVSAAIRGLPGFGARRGDEASVAAGALPPSSVGAVTSTLVKSANQPSTGAVGLGSGSSNSNEVNIQNMTINTQATDADGISRSIKPALARNTFIASVNGGPQ